MPVVPREDGASGRQADAILVSIVTVNYNGAATLPRLLAGVGELLCEHADFEHVIVDGASLDHSVALFEAHVAQHANARFVSERDKGIYDAMNKGVRLTRGDYFIHLNSDDEVIHVERWRAIAELLRERRPLVLATPVPIQRANRTLRILPAKPLSSLHRRLGFHFPHQGTFFAREPFERVAGYSTAIGYIADKVFCYRLLDQIDDADVVYHQTPIAIQHAGGVSSNSSLTPLKTLWLAIKSARKVDYSHPYLRAVMNPLFKIVLLARPQGTNV